VELTLIEETVHFLSVCRKLAKPVNDLNLKLLWTRVRLPPSPFIYILKNPPPALFTNACEVFRLTKGASENKTTPEGTYSMCKRSERRENIKRKMMEFYKSNPCVDCGEEDPRVLDFDHLNNKKHNVSTLLRKEYSWESILLEASKCEVRCANCHRRKTAIEQSHYTNRLLKEYFCSTGG
jgi:hypothetical protein